MNWGRGKSLDYVFVYSTGSYGDDGLDIGFGTAFENIDEVIKQLKISMREHISELIQYSNIENVMANLKRNLVLIIGLKKILMSQLWWFKPYRS